MSKILKQYRIKKENNKDKYYLFKTGMFYIFVDEDAVNISKITPLKLTNLNGEVLKCGFPNNSLERYLEIFKNLNVDIEIIDNTEDKDRLDKLLNKVKNMDLMNITPANAIKVLQEIKESLNEE